MTKYLFGLLCLAILQYACSNTQKVDKSLVYSTLNEIVQQDSIIAHIVCSKFDRISIPDQIQNEYFKDDKEFLREQLKGSVNATLDTGKLYFYWKRKRALEKSFIDTTCSKNIFCRLTYPVFSKDLQTVVIGVTEDCNCMLGGWGFKAVYKKKEGKWLKIKDLIGG